MTLLVLAGTSDARQLLEGLQGADIIASLAGVTRSPAKLPAVTRKGGFGGVQGFRDYLLANKITGVVDATHPFAGKMTQTAATVCAKLDLPHVILQRTEWKAVVGDDWHFVDSVAETVGIISDGATVFLGTGRQTLHEFSCLVGRKLYARVIDPPEAPVLAGFNGEFLIGTPPFSIAEEVALFREKGIEWLVVKNAGGCKSRSKLDAARALGLSVVMINRPKLPKADVVGSVDAALNWVRDQGW
jgi:precorrin-6A/cobalt-precorrin-6A reductase